MATIDPLRSQHLTGQDWFWVVFVAVVATIATFGGFVLFLPAYVLAIVAGVIATRRFPFFFNRAYRSLFVLKVLAVVLFAFGVLSLLELVLLPSVYKPPL